MNTKNLLEKPVFTLGEAELISNVSEIIYDKKLTKALYLRLDNDSLVPYNSIKKISNNAILIKSNKFLKNELKKNENVLSLQNGTKVYSLASEYKGTINEILCKSRNGTITNIKLVDGGTISPKHITSVSNNSLIISK